MEISNEIWKICLHDDENDTLLNEVYCNTSDLHDNQFFKYMVNLNVNKQIYFLPPSRMEIVGF